MRFLARFCAAFILTATLASTANAQDDSWHRRWYWGAQAGTVVYGSNTAFSAGGHWMITGTRTALKISFDAIDYGGNTLDSLTNAELLNNAGQTGNTLFSFSSGRAITAELLAIPTNNKLQVYGGVGFSIAQVTGLNVQSSGANGATPNAFPQTPP